MSNHDEAVELSLDALTSWLAVEASYDRTGFYGPKLEQAAQAITTLKAQVAELEARLTIHERGEDAGYQQTLSDLTVAEARAEAAEAERDEWKEKFYIEAEAQFSARVKASVARDKAKIAEAENEKLREALIWCSGSADFHEGGQAREGWLKLCQPLIAAALSTPQQPTEEQ